MASLRAVSLHISEIFAPYLICIVGVLVGGAFPASMFPSLRCLEPGPYARHREWRCVQAISCFATLKQRLGLRFPNQGTAADSLAISNEACHAAADICFALRIAKDAARRMPRSTPPLTALFSICCYLSAEVMLFSGSVLHLSDACSKQSNRNDHPVVLLQLLLLPIAREYIVYVCGGHCHQSQLCTVHECSHDTAMHAN